METEMGRNYETKNKRFGWIKRLETIMGLPIYGFNSGRFDLVCMLDGIIKWCDQSYPPRNTSYITRGRSFMTFQIQQLESEQIFVFKDVLNFTSPCSLSDYLKQWKTTEQKGAFPHGYVIQLCYRCNFECNLMIF